jgi:hypothetical protein
MPGRRDDTDPFLAHPTPRMARPKQRFMGLLLQDIAAGRTCCWAPHFRSGPSEDA